MRSVPRPLVTLLVAGILAMGFVACGSEDSDSDVGSLKISGNGSASFIEPGGDNSVQNFGREASKAELTAAATALHDYLVARAEKDYELACSLLSKRTLKEQEQLAKRSPEVDGEGCPAALAARAVGISNDLLVELTEVDAASLRTGAQLNFLLYLGAKDTRYFILMAKEGDGWKVDDLSPTAF